MDTLAARTDECDLMKWKFSTLYLNFFSPDTSGTTLGLFELENSQYFVVQ